MTVGPSTSEEELRWEKEPPMYHIAIVRVDGWKQDDYKLHSPEVTIITTFAEMNAFRPDADYDSRSFGAFRETMKQYGAPIFENNGSVLIAIHTTDSTGSASYSVESVDADETAIDIELKRTCPDGFDTDMAQWLIFIELEKAVYTGQRVNVELTGV